MRGGVSPPWRADGRVGVGTKKELQKNDKTDVLAIGAPVLLIPLREQGETRYNPLVWKERLEPLIYED